MTNYPENTQEEVAHSRLEGRDLQQGPRPSFFKPD